MEIKSPKEINELLKNSQQYSFSQIIKKEDNKNDNTNTRENTKK